MVRAVRRPLQAGRKPSAKRLETDRSSGERPSPPAARRCSRSPAAVPLLLTTKRRGCHCPRLQGEPEEGTMTTAIVAAAMLAGAILEDGVATKEFLRGATPQAGKLSDDVRALRNASKGAALKAKTTGGVPGIDSLVNFSDQFIAPGFDDRGNPQSVWPYTMVGQAP